MYINEHTTGFQCNNKYNIHITYKRIGDSFQIDAIREEGFTYDFVFWDYVVPNSGHLFLCALQKQILHLFQDLKYDWMRLFMNNPYNLRNLEIVTYNEKAPVYGVTMIH